MIRVFNFFQVVRAVEGEGNLGNHTMYDNIIKVYRNTSNRIGLEVKRLDRRAIILSNDKRYFFNVMARDGERFLIRKQFEVDDFEKGRLVLVLAPEDLDLITPDRYVYSVSYVDHNSDEFIAYTSNDADGYSEFIVSDRAYAAQRPPFVQFNFTRMRSATEGNKIFLSSRLPISKPEHSLELDFSDFSGKVLIEKTRDVDPNQQSSWTEHLVFDYANNSISEVIPLTLDAQYVRVKIIDDLENQGSVTELRFS